MTKFQLEYKQFGERSILIEWPSKIDLNILNDIIPFKALIRTLLHQELIEVNNAYSSLVVIYKNSIRDFEVKKQE